MEFQDKTTSVDRIRVAAGILCDADGRILITERLGDVSFAGLWEFPGGKIEAGEKPAAALERELMEELGVEIVSFKHFQCVDHEYPDRHVIIDFFLVSHWLGAPSGLHGQRLKWLPIESLDENVLLPADAPVVRALHETQRTD